ncbi:MAG TPA: hypothetical protein VGN68_19945, partial [Sphingopyxis sp.]|uniref:hypothetical protein n=1 Tax=Sphingopyxis sp. TaxID=1908224 RepID=UPI002E0E796D|nr:hypothetical protein [Sphingopyxis sp.]
ALRAPPGGLRPPSAARSARLTSTNPYHIRKGVLLRRRSGVPFERRLTALIIFNTGWIASILIWIFVIEGYANAVTDAAG